MKDFWKSIKSQTIFDKDGHITCDDLYAVMAALKFSLRKDECADIIGYEAWYEMVDAGIDYPQFVTIMTRKFSFEKEKRLREEFKEIDTDGSGFISASELRKCIDKEADGGEKMTDEDFDAIILAADVDGDGQVSYDEFVKLMNSEDEDEEDSEDEDEEHDE